MLVPTRVNNLPTPPFKPSGGYYRYIGHRPLDAEDLHASSDAARLGWLWRPLGIGGDLARAPSKVIRLANLGDCSMSTTADGPS